MAARSILRLTLSLLVFVSSMLGAAPAYPQGLPPQALILGVPFISWSEARKLDYEEKDILNPSSPAAIGMVLEYWGKDLKLLKNLEEALKPGGWAVVESGNAQSIEDLKPFISQGYPVVVNPAITPVAHPLSPLFARLAKVEASRLPGDVPSQGRSARWFLWPPFAK